MGCVEEHPSTRSIIIDETPSPTIHRYNCRAFQFRFSFFNNILTYCYHYDPTTNTHSLIVARVVQLGGVVTMGLLGGFMFLMFRKDYTQGHQGNAGRGIQRTWDRKKVNG